MTVSEEDRIANESRIEESKTLFEINKLMKEMPVYIDFTNRLSIPFESPDKELDLWVEDDHVTVVNCYTQKSENIPVDQITGFRYMTINKEPSKEQTENAISRDLEQIKLCVDDETIDFSLEEIINKYCVVNQTVPEWEMQKLFKLKYSIDQLKTSDETTMSGVRKQYMDLIRSYRSKSFEELDALEQEIKESGGDDQDLDDIDSIKQMFRDIPQDTDLSEYKTVHEMLQFWPSLLLPKPDTLPTQSDIDTISRAPQLDELRDILMKIRNVFDLRLFFSELKANIGVDNIPESAIKMVKNRILVLERTQDITL